MACLLVGANPLSEPILEFYYFEHEEQTSVKFIHFHSRIYIGNSRLRNGSCNLGLIVLMLKRSGYYHTLTISTMAAGPSHTLQVTITTIGDWNIVYKNSRR